MSSVTSGSCFSFHAFKLRVKISWPPLLSLLLVFLKLGSKVRVNKMEFVASLDLSLPPEDHTIGFRKVCRILGSAFMKKFSDYFLIFNLFYGKCERIHCLKFRVGSISFQGFRNIGKPDRGDCKENEPFFPTVWWFLLTSVEFHVTSSRRYPRSWRKVQQITQPLSFYCGRQSCLVSGLVAMAEQWEWRKRMRGNSRNMLRVIDALLPLAASDNQDLVLQDFSLIPKATLEWLKPDLKPLLMWNRH